MLGKSIQLEEEQLKEYHKLKNVAAQRTAHYQQELDSINREQKSDQDRLDNEQRRTTEVENQLRQKGHGSAPQQIIAGGMIVVDCEE